MQHCKIDCIVQAVDTDDGPAGAVTYELESEGNIEDGNHVFSIGCRFLNKFFSKLE